MISNTSMRTDLKVEVVDKNGSVFLSPNKGGTGTSKSRRFFPRPPSVTHSRKELPVEEEEKRIFPEIPRHEARSRNHAVIKTKTTGFKSSKRLQKQRSQKEAPSKVFAS